MSGLYLGNGKSERVELKPDRLTTHGVILGMTGSGKTGFGLVLLEELARKNVPIIAIDPKGDLSNLSFLFPDFAPESFAPWMEDPNDAAETAARWQKGVEASGLSTDDVRAVRENTDIRVFTPGSNAGFGVDLLGALKKPSGNIAADPEARGALLQSTVSGILGLAGHNGDPMRDPAHIVLTRIVDEAWQNDEDVDLATAILQLVNPPFEKVGVFPTDQFFPPEDRMDIATALNGVLASPSFAQWSQGSPLDPEEMLRSDGKTKVSIFHLAHLDEVGRTFFLSLLLGKLLAHSRQMKGTSELRGLIYFDEVAGFLPPHPKNPPTKAPLLTMMKQSRAVGLGVVLSTQNPVDLDYKALSNAGIWAIGRLQTQQDRDRVLKGMGQPELDDVVESLKKREFVLFDAKADAPMQLKSRHAMCYLRGPLTRNEIKSLCASDLVAQPAAVTTTPAAPAQSAERPASSEEGLLRSPPKIGDALYLDTRAIQTKALAPIFAPHLKAARDDGAIHYAPALWADLHLHFDEERTGFFAERRERRLFFPLGESAELDAHIELPLPDEALRPEPEGKALFSPLPDWFDEKKERKALEKRVVDDVYRKESLGRFVHRKLKLNSNNDEDKEAFLARVKSVAGDQRDEWLRELHEKYQKKADRLETRFDKAEQKVMELRGRASQSRTEEAVNIGATLFSMFAGGGRMTGAKVNRAVSRRGRSSNASRRLQTAENNLAKVEDDIEALQTELEEKIQDVQDKADALMNEITEKEVRLEKNDIRVDRFGVLWIPVTAQAI